MTHIARLIGSIAIICALFTGAPAGAQETANTGLALARQLCSECHAVERAPARSPNPSSPPFETIANVPGMTGMALSAALQSPHRSMPNVMLDSSQLGSIVAYILSLRRAN
ncbi:MAG: cytochrome C [Proteobacteria bacterium]|jgi:mono/diheme cytochrome c family protein|nr:MAG: cytochrome C [Pseudomonadota bacterium]